MWSHYGTCCGKYTVIGGMLHAVTATTATLSGSGAATIQAAGNFLGNNIRAWPALSKSDLAIAVERLEPQLPIINNFLP